MLDHHRWVVSSFVDDWNLLSNAMGAPKGNPRDPTGGALGSPRPMGGFCREPKGSQVSHGIPWVPMGAQPRDPMEGPPREPKVMPWEAVKELKAFGRAPEVTQGKHYQVITNSYVRPTLGRAFLLPNGTLFEPR